MQSKDQKMDHRTYRIYMKEAYKEIDTTSTNYQKYILSAYPYFRSRVLVPGRNYADDDHGPIAIGGSAHVDLIDLEIWLAKQSDSVQAEALDWINGSSLEKTAHWRGLKTTSASTIKRRRDKIVDNLAQNAKKLDQKS